MSPLFLFFVKFFFLHNLASLRTGVNVELLVACVLTQGLQYTSSNVENENKQIKQKKKQNTIATEN